MNNMAYAASPGLYIRQKGQWRTANNINVKTSAPPISIAFYDWDDTLLGIRAVKVGGSLIDPNTVENRPSYVNADGTPKYTDDELAAMDVAPLSPEGALLGTTPGNKNEAVPIYNKAGYTYAGWVDFSGTSVPNVEMSADAGQTIERNGQSLIPLTNLRENLRLRAAYNESSLGVSASNRRYQVDYTPFSFDDQRGYLHSSVYLCRTELSRRVNDEKILKLTLRIRGGGEFNFSFALGQADLEIYDLYLPILSSEILNTSNGVSLSAKNKNDSTIANTVGIASAELVNPSS